MNLLHTFAIVVFVVLGFGRGKCLHFKTSSKLIAHKNWISLFIYLSRKTIILQKIKLKKNRLLNNFEKSFIVLV